MAYSFSLSAAQQYNQPVTQMQENDVIQPLSVSHDLQQKNQVAICTIKAHTE